MTIQAKIPTTVRARIGYTLRGSRIPNTLSPRLAEVVAYLTKHPAAPRARIAEAVNGTLNVVAGAIFRLEQMKLIKRTALDAPREHRAHRGVRMPAAASADRAPRAPRRHTR